MSVSEKRHCQCKHSPKVAQRILKLTTFKAESHELSNWACNRTTFSETVAAVVVTSSV